LSRTEYARWCRVRALQCHDDPRRRVISVVDFDFVEIELRSEVGDIDGNALFASSLRSLRLESRYKQLAFPSYTTNVSNDNNDGFASSPLSLIHQFISWTLKNNVCAVVCKIYD